MRTAIHQPNFLPWIGFFGKIRSVDNFVLFDDVQFERGKTFTSRAKIVVQGNEHWLTVPVTGKGDLPKINEIKVDDNFIWKKKLLRTIETTYRKSPYFNEIFSIVSKEFDNESKLLVDYNINLITQICNYLDLRTKFIRSSEIDTCKDLNGLDKIVGLLTHLKSSKYISGSGAGSKRYIDEAAFSKNNIGLEWQNYKPIEYPRFNSNKSFTPYLSIIDLLFNHGKASVEFI